jgi:outer membrane protein TolC
VEQARSTLEATQQGLRAGTRARVDLLRADLALRQAQGGLAQARAEEASNMRLLALMTGLTALPPLAPAAPIASDLALPSQAELEPLRDQPALAIASDRERREAALLAAAKGRRWPKVQIEAAYGWDSLALPWQTGPGWSAGVSLSMPLFDGGALRAREDAADLALNGAKERYRQARLDVRQALAAALGQAQAALAAYQTARDLAEAKGEVWRISREGYRAGQLSSRELSLAQQDWVSSQLAWLEDAARLRLALAKMQILAGRLPVEHGR